MLLPLHGSLGLLGRRYAVGAGVNARWNNLVGGYKMDEFSDESVGVVRADVLGVYDLTDNNTVPSIAGIIGNAAHFTAAESEYLSTPAPALFAAGDIRTVTFWYYMTADGGNPSLWQVANNPGDVGRALIYVSGTAPNKTITMYANGGGTTSAGFFGLNEWHQVVYTFDGVNSHKLYVDTVLRATRTVTDGGGATNMFFGTSGAGFHNGYIDEGYVFSDFKDTDWILDMHNSGAGRSYPN